MLVCYLYKELISSEIYSIMMHFVREKVPLVTWNTCAPHCVFILDSAETNHRHVFVGKIQKEVHKKYRSDLAWDRSIPGLITSVYFPLSHIQSNVIMRVRMLFPWNCSVILWHPGGMPWNSMGYKISEWI